MLGDFGLGDADPAVFFIRAEINSINFPLGNPFINRGFCGRGAENLFQPPPEDLDG